MNANPARRPLVPALEEASKALLVLTPFTLLLGLMALAVCPLSNLEMKAERAGIDLEHLHDALRLYQSRTGRLPTSDEGLQPLIDQGVLEKLPDEPWSNPYLYSLRGGTLELGSLGADGVLGGDGEDKDIVLRCDVDPVTQALLRCEPNPPARDGPP
ncbi:general secretion pathway protein G [Myxococcus stipitatus DSM 14675]|uniref:General secretion pathway protein G n=1 Tax=Myxococcus stipitatus (strain DSM 14675 / JCM 12634 / Mx s8) TaxID=1278073 RepID=L7U078_MYXSD|nr:type II secretion system protein GspG [Myxococcus stipitatus]AGC41648.1 general secretion pathway protein G [Myxococcus stipitatus DSM 14675]